MNMVTSGERDRSKYAFLIREKKENMSHSSCITHVRRNCNSSSHVLANFGSKGRSVVWLGSGPDVVLDAVKRYCI